jgi:hypothetical protein
MQCFFYCWKVTSFFRIQLYLISIWSLNITEANVCGAKKLKNGVILYIKTFEFSHFIDEFVYNVTIFFSQSKICNSLLKFLN